jgi:hypothetical protein
MKIFKDILPLLSNLKPMTRFEIKARLPKDTYVDHHPEPRNDCQYVWDVIIAMWKELEWIHLPTPHIQRSMERVLDFATSTQVPKRCRCFNVFDGKTLDKNSKNFAATTFLNLGYVSKWSNAVFMETYDRQPDPPHPVAYPINWYVYCAWLYHFETIDPDETDYQLYYKEKYLKLFCKERLISPICQEEDSTTMNLTHCE